MNNVYGCLVYVCHYRLNQCQNISSFFFFVAKTYMKIHSLVRSYNSFHSFYYECLFVTVHYDELPTSHHFGTHLYWKKSKQYNRLHAKYVAGILREATIRLKRLPNLNQASTAISKQVTICGDLHGKLDDLLVVFHKVSTNKFIIFFLFFFPVSHFRFR